MVFALLALQLLGNADSVQIGAGQAIDQAVTTSLANNKLQTKQATEQGAERYTVQVYAGRRIDANSLYMRLTTPSAQYCRSSSISTNRNSRFL